MVQGTVSDKAFYSCTLQPTLLNLHRPWHLIVSASLPTSSTVESQVTPLTWLSTVPGELISSTRHPLVPVCSSGCPKLGR